MCNAKQASRWFVQLVNNGLGYNEAHVFITSFMTDNQVQAFNGFVLGFLTNGL